MIDGYVQKSAITDGILIECRDRFGEDIQKEDIFFYVYGALHSPGYRSRYENELKKELARLPLPGTAADFWTCCDVGRELADLHVNYETGISTIPARNGKPHNLPAPYPIKTRINAPDGLDDAALYRVDAKMKIGSRDETRVVREVDAAGRETVKEVKVKVFTGVMRYNEHIDITDIPADAFRYVVNGRCPLQWIAEYYYRKTNKESGILNDPNLWSDDPKYIFNLIPRLIALSLRTLELVETLPDVG